MTPLDATVSPLLIAALYHLLCAAGAALLSWQLLGYVSECADVETVQYRQKLHIPIAAIFGFAVPLIVPDLNPIRVVGFTALAALLAHLAVADAGQEILPDRLNLPVFVITFAMTLTSAWQSGDIARATVSLACGIGVFVAYLLMLAIRPHQFGAGDVKLGPSIGMMLGWFGAMPVLYGWAAGFALHALAGLYLIARRSASSTRNLLPFGPAMITAAYVTMAIAAQ